MAKAAEADFRAFCRLLRADADSRLAIARRDWPFFLEGARRHRVEPLLLAGLKASGTGPVPDRVWTELRRDAQRAAGDSLMQMGELARVARLFDRAAIPMMALKGVALSVQLGRDPAMRNSRDIDLLVAPEQLGEADRILREGGYRPAGPPVTARLDAQYRRWGKEIKYVHPETHVLIELHYRLSDNPALLDWRFADLWRERETVEVAGASVSVMSGRHLALYLCIHGAAHGWERLCWLLDLAAVLEREGAGAAMDEAAVQGLTAPMLQAVGLAHDWLGMPVGGYYLARARACSRTKWLARILDRAYRPSTWYRSPARGSLAGFLRYSVWQRLYVYSLKSDWRYRKNQLARELMAPADWEAFRLPEKWTWAYPLIRPLGWLVRRLKGAV